MAEWRYETGSAAETERLGALLGALLPCGTVVWLHGELGAGKTCLTRGVARGLGVPAAEPVTSPTYALMNLYRGRCPLWHFDLYRLDGPGQLEEIDFFDALESGGVVVVEWAERAGDQAAAGVRITLAAGGGETRRQCVIASSDPALAGPLAELARRWRSDACHEAV